MPPHRHFEVPWHSGEKQMHKLMHVKGQGNPNSPFLTPGAGYMVSESPLIALGTVDADGRPWTSVYGGIPGFARPVAESVLGIDAIVDNRFDPVVEALLGGKNDEEIVTADENEKIMGGLAIDLETRERVKLHGKMLAGILNGGKSIKKSGDSTSTKEMQLAMNINKSLGNCPKYLNKKHIIPSTPSPTLISNSPKLPPQAVSLLQKADIFFMSSFSLGRNPDMDTNHRGGPSGFIRLLSNSPSGAQIIYPEYSGNRLYESLGNLVSNPRIGIVVPDFENGDVLYLTGTTEILIGEKASAVLLHSDLAVKITISSARFVEKGLNFRGIKGEASPYNPPLRYTTFEKPDAITSPLRKGTYLTLLQATKLTTTISRYRFKVDDSTEEKIWKAGQYVTLGFEEHMKRAWSHMRESDPGSLNDDFIRTFTISSPPSNPRGGSPTSPNTEFEITARNVGKVTNFLSRQRKGFKVLFKGFGGNFGLDEKDKGIFPFIAGGIGITPLLAHMDEMDMDKLRLFWSINTGDLGLVVDTLTRYPGLAGRMRLFVTGTLKTDKQKEMLEDMKKSGVIVEQRRIEKADLEVTEKEGGVEKWYMCVGVGLKTQVLKWLEGKRVVYEDFGY